MKPKLLMVICFFAAMAMIPLLCVNAGKPKRNGGSDKLSETDLCSVVCNYCRNDYCDSAIDAVSCIIRTNSKCGKRYNGKDNSDKELYHRVKKIFNSNSELLYQRSSVSSIPFAPCSNGSTIAEGKQSSVASPWDCFSSRYDPKNRCTGISLDGVDYLCKNGFSKKEAIKWYIPEAEIK